MNALYRYEDHHGAVVLVPYPIRKTTPAGVWIDMGTRSFTDKGVYKPTLKFVHLGKRKRYACPTEEEAKESFFARKNRQLGIMQAQITNIEKAVAALKAGVVGQQYYSFDID